MKIKPRYTVADRTPKPANGIEYFYAGLLQLGVTLQLTDGDQISILSPDNNVSPVLRQAVEQRKASLLPLLKERQPAEVEF